jgi:hypothetical protein
VTIPYRWLVGDRIQLSFCEGSESNDFAGVGLFSHEIFDRHYHKMLPIYARIRERARQIASHFPAPDFYRDHAGANRYSQDFFEKDPVVKKLRQFVTDHLEDDFGHGLHHAIKVAVEGGALMTIEGKPAGYTAAVTAKRVRVVQCAGLLHDMKRKTKDHAKRGAVYARKVLSGYPLRADEIDDVCLAIHNHEAFKSKISIDTPQGILVADCLYDADKFRWGPDNFTDTLWDMVSFFKPSLNEFMDRYPQGMEGIEKIRSTFRTPTGKKYGPQFIDLGVAIGQELYEVIKVEFSEYL